MSVSLEKGLSEKEFTRKKALWPFLKRLFLCSLHYKTWFWTLVASATLVAVIDALFPLIWLRYIDDFIDGLMAIINFGAHFPGWGIFDIGSYT